MVPPEARHCGTVEQKKQKYFSPKRYCSFKVRKCLLVPNFEAIGPVTLVFGPENHPKSLA